MLIVFIVAGLIAGVLLFAATKPATFRVERTVPIKAPTASVFALIDDFHNWRQWSPWEDLDPNLQRGYSGAAHGVGAVYEWSGNQKAGQGRMEILESVPGMLVRIKLDFLKPVEGHNTADFTLRAVGETTSVTWLLYGPNTYLTKVMSVFVSMDKFLGDQFQVGLEKMKSVAER